MLFPMRDAAWLGIHTLRRRTLRRLMKRFRLLSSIFGALLLSSVLAVVVVLRRRAVRCDEQPVSLLSLVLSRAPPSQLALA